MSLQKVENSLGHFEGLSLFMVQILTSVYVTSHQTLLTNLLDQQVIQQQLQLWSSGELMLLLVIQRRSLENL